MGKLVVSIVSVGVGIALGVMIGWRMCVASHWELAVRPTVAVASIEGKPDLLIFYGIPPRWPGMVGMFDVGLRPREIEVGYLFFHWPPLGEYSMQEGPAVLVSAEALPIGEDVRVTYFTKDERHSLGVVSTHDGATLTWTPSRPQTGTP